MGKIFLGLGAWALVFNCFANEVFECSYLASAALNSGHLAATITFVGEKEAIVEETSLLDGSKVAAALRYQVVESARRQKIIKLIRRSKGRDGVIETLEKKIFIINQGLNASLYKKLGRRRRSLRDTTGLHSEKIVEVTEEESKMTCISLLEV